MPTQRYDSGAEATTDPLAETNRLGCLGWLDSLATMLFTIFLAMTVIGFGCLAASEFVKDAGKTQLAFIAILMLFGVIVDAYFVALVFRCFFASTRKLPLAAALRQHVLPWPCRPMLACYWLVHFLAGAVLVMVIERSAIRDYHQGRDDFSGLAFAMLFGYGITYAANTYFLAAVAAMTRNPFVLLVAWRLRLLIDLAVAVGTPLVFGNSRIIWTWLG